MLLRLQALLVLCAAALAQAAQSQAIQIPAAPDQTASPNASSATIHQNVNNVLVDVVVTDKNGRPVTDLSKERFQVLENGAPQEIAFFEEHKAAPPSPVPAHPLQLPPQIYTNIANVPDNGPTMVLLMDALNTPINDQAKVRAAIVDFLHKIPQGRHIAIFTLTSKLRMVQGFNNDPSTLIATLNDATNWQKQSHLTDDPGQDSYADFMTANLSRDSAYVAHEEAWRTDQKVAYTLNALNSLATYLSALPGRKNLIWFSGSFPLGLGPDSPMPQGFDPSKFTSENLDRSRSYGSALHQTSELMKLARVAVYPMLAGGPSTPSQFSSATTTGNLMSSTSSLANPATMIDNANIETSTNISSNATMDTIADVTGGRAFHSAYDLVGALATVTQLGSNYYTIAYAPKDDKYDGKYRKLTVKVDAPKVKLDYRRGYYAEDPDKSGVSALAHPSNTASIVLRGAPNATDILFKVRVAPTENPAQKPQPGSVRYSVNWSVDLHGVALSQSANGLRHGALELIVVAYNQDSKAVNTVSNSASLILQPEEYTKYLETGLRFHQELELPAGQVYLRVAAVDPTSNRAGATEIPLDIRENMAQTRSPAQPVTPH